ncbi:MAG: peptidase S10 [Thermomonas hydrothermalis]|uniref:S10 family peptidase n=1 Tax=Thermomonas hydrothermalis TaxID=213588 RepID=UPI002356A8DC|nr:peptidase S10 [Thermomonas hydrothermalis]MCL6619576.1 peptidase S10 [Thermomonas hydrothermalis]
MRRLVLAAALTSALLAHSAAAYAGQKADRQEAATSDIESPDAALLKSQTSQTEGSVTVAGKRIDYRAVAGTLVLHGQGDKEHEPTASVFYVAYFKKDATPGKRPITFLYNGGPGSATVWLHMGAFGPRRVVTNDDTHTPPAPYRLINNDSSLLDASDLVFIDAPGAGFSRLIADEKDPAKRAELMKMRKQDIYSVDGDARAFAQFITQFLSRYNRWNSPKYLFGESYGTTRSAVLANILQNQMHVDLNGVILLSQILSFDTSIDGPEHNPGIDLPYVLALPTFAATAYYHHRLPEQPAALEPFLAEVERFAGGEYAAALFAGANLEPTRKQAIAEKLHAYTGLPVDYLLRANLRVTGGMFEQSLLADDSMTAGRLDSRFSGPSLDPLAKNAGYDPLIASIAPTYVALFNDYVRQQLKFGDDRTYRLFADIEEWGMKHDGHDGALNVMGDLAATMKTNPQLKVLLTGGYYDVATPYFAAKYEMAHLPIPASLQKNIRQAWYPAGHMVYAHEPSLKALHDDVARFIDETSRQP